MKTLFCSMLAAFWGQIASPLLAQDDYNRQFHQDREGLAEKWQSAVSNRGRDWLLQTVADPTLSYDVRIGSALTLLENYQDPESRKAAMEAALLRVRPGWAEFESSMNWRLLLPVAAKAIQFPELMPVLVEKAVRNPHHDFQITWPLTEYQDAGVDPVPELQRWHAQLTDPALKEWCDRLLERVDPVRSEKFYANLRKQSVIKQRELDAAKAAAAAQGATPPPLAPAPSGPEPDPASSPLLWPVAGGAVVLLLALGLWWWRGDRKTRG
jgi:hypothetical protein